MKNFIRYAGVVSLVVLTGCATPNTGIVPMGSGQYIISKTKGFGNYWGSEIRVDLLREAAAFCAKSGKDVLPTSSKTTDAGFDSYASAEVQFSCR